MKEFFGSRLLRWLTVPYRSRLFTVASKPFYQVADRVLGSRFLQDIAEFFILFQTMEAGFVARATRGRAAARRPAHHVRRGVARSRRRPRTRRAFLADELQRRRHALGAMVLNRTLPPALRQPAAAKAAARLPRLRRRRRRRARGRRRGCGADPGERAAPCSPRSAERFHDVAVVAEPRGRTPRRAGDARRPSPSSCPALTATSHDLAGLLDARAVTCGALNDAIAASTDRRQRPRSGTLGSPWPRSASSPGSTRR